MKVKTNYKSAMCAAVLPQMENIPVVLSEEEIDMINLIDSFNQHLNSVVNPMDPMEFLRVAFEKEGEGLTVNLVSTVWSPMEIKRFLTDYVTKKHPELLVESKGEEEKEV